MSTASPRTRKARSAGSPLRRRITGMLALMTALIGSGLAYTVLAPEPQTAQAQEDTALVRQGEALYNNSCISCHGSNLQGVTGRGPTLIGVGEAAVYFQVSTGRMPAARQEAQAAAKPVKFTPEEIDALGAFVQANGGGPRVPHEELSGGDPASGGELFRLNCASCHNFTGRGGALSSGKYAPEIADVNAKQIYTAMLTGPQNMPRFSDRQLTPEEKKDIIAYVETVRESRSNPGGYYLGGFGPVPEGLIAFIVGLAAMVGIALYIGAKA